MGSKLRLAVPLLAVIAVMLLGATASIAATTVTICHKPGPDAETLNVNDNSLAAHLNHGDHLGACAASPADDENAGSQDERQPEEEGQPQDEGLLPTGSSTWTPGESRSLYCSTKGPVDRGNGEHPGVALNLTESQGALLVENGLVTPAIFYSGLGVSCDVLPGFVYAGYWVDHVGDVVPGVAVYPYYVPSAG